MKKESVKNHLKTYSIVQKRRTTLNHAFASAIAPTERYNAARVRDAIIALGQDPDEDLSCVYCGAPATTWDHLVGLVENSQLRGYGHQLGNLVPSCSRCNEKKGAKDWKEFVRSSEGSPQLAATKIEMLEAYLNRFAARVDLDRVKRMRPAEWRRYEEVRSEIDRLMTEADTLAASLREFVVDDALDSNVEPFQSL